MLIHGLAEHLGVYDELGCRMAAENFLAFGHDHRKLFLLLLIKFKCNGIPSHTAGSFK
jgi:hypothetical protein